MSSSACSNCGVRGHFFRECPEPILSLGIIAFKKGEGEGPSWLLVRRRVSIGFIELLRGKYDPSDVPGVQALIDQATLHERSLLQTRSFSELWRILWNGPATKRYQSDYDQSKAKFDAISSSGLMRALCLSSTTAWMEPEWGFPKGRRSNKESELECALRETSEEAGVAPSLLTVFKDQEFIEEYRGSNGIIYKNHYWLARAPSDLEVSVNPLNADQQREISDVRWCSLEEATTLIRPYATAKIAVLHQASTVVTNLKS